MLRQECKRVAAVSATPRSSPPSRRRSWRSRATALAVDPALSEFPPPLFHRALAPLRIMSGALGMSQSARVLVPLYYLAPRVTKGDSTSPYPVTRAERVCGAEPWSH